VVQQQSIIPDSLLMQEEFTLYDFGTERAFLALIMKHPELIVEAERVIRPEWLFAEFHRYTYKIMLWMYRVSTQRNWPLNLDPMSMLSAAQYSGVEQQFRDRTEGLNAIKQVEALSQAVRMDMFPQFVGILTDRAARVDLYRRARDMQRQVVDIQSNPVAQNIALSCESQFAEIAFRGVHGGDGRMINIAEEQDNYLLKTRLNWTYPNDSLFNVACPLFPFWSRLMNGGYRKRGLTILAARPKVGKSTLLLSIAIAMALQFGIPVLYLDTEMSAEEQISRGLSHVAGVNEFDLIKGKMWADGMGEMAQAVDRARDQFNKAKFIYAQIGNRPVTHVQSLMRQFRNKYVGTKEYMLDGKTYTFSNPAMVIYDWLKLPDAGSLREAAEYQMLGFQAQAIKETAGELDLPVIAGAQNNRAAINVDVQDWQEMAESFVAGSDRLAQFCTMLCILRNLTGPEAERQVAHGWTREGRTGMQGLRFNQMLHVILQRGGPNFPMGIPLYIDRGFARYEECATDEVLKFAHEASKKAKASEKVRLPDGKSPAEAAKDEQVL
jgi:replicative DNA helicase